MDIEQKVNKLITRIVERGSEKCVSTAGLNRKHTAIGRMRCDLRRLIGVDNPSRKPDPDGMPGWRISVRDGDWPELVPYPVTSVGLIEECEWGGLTAAIAIHRAVQMYPECYGCVMTAKEVLL